jgi:hypothetical protein
MRPADIRRLYELRAEYEDRRREEERAERERRRHGEDRAAPPYARSAIDVRLAALGLLLGADCDLAEAFRHVDGWG